MLVPRMCARKFPGAATEKGARYCLNSSARSHTQLIYIRSFGLCGIDSAPIGYAVGTSRVWRVAQLRCAAKLHPARMTSAGRP